MFSNLKLTNFMKYPTAEFSFAEGLNVVRGASEAGKTTMLRGILYGLGGVRATGLAAEDLVRWGARPAEMKTELTITADGVNYLIKRSPAGAEVWFSGRAEPDVTGQNEVTEFVTRLVGVDIAGLQSLMFAQQNGIRGALDEGPAATVALIEELAELNQIDALISLVNEQLPTGATATIESRIAVLTQQIADLKAKTFPDTERLQVKIASLRADSEAGEARVATLQQGVEALREQIGKVQAHADRAAVLTQSLALRQLSVSEKKEALLKAREAAGKPLKDTAELSARLADAQAATKTLNIYRKALPALTLPEVHWDGSYGEYTAAVARAQADLEKARAELNTLDRDTAVLKSQITDAKNCSYCGKDVSQLPGIKEKNDKLLADLEAAGMAAALAVNVRAEAQQHLKDLQGLTAGHNSNLKLAAEAGGLVEVLDVTVPATLRWVGPDITTLKALDTQALTDLLKAAEAHNRTVSEAAGRIPALKEALATEEARLVEVSAELKEAQAAVVDMSSAKETLKEAQGALQQAKDAQSALLYKVFDTVKEVEAVERDKHATEVEVQLLGRQVGEAGKELAEMQDNNQLIKDLRRVRPIVAEKVWNMVLAAVSTFFSSMRGEDSIVERSGKIFTVNGKGVAGLSGSTKDILGLAIRMALTTTFLPNARFLVLDEPWAACDASRSERCLGFLRSTGFDQILMVTHEDNSEAVADALIQL